MTDYEAIAREIVREHTTFKIWKDGKPTDEVRTSYDPVYFDRGFNETHTEVVGAFVSGEESYGFPIWRELAYDVLDEGVGDSVEADARSLADDYALKHDVDAEDLRLAIRDLLYDAITQDYAREWVTGMRDPAVRVQLDGWADPMHMDIEEDTPESLLAHAGIEATEKNIEAAKVIMNEAWHSLGYYNLFLVFRLDLSDVSEGDKVNIKGEAELWATNVYQGDGMAETVEVDLTLDRSLLATDEDAAGYSYCEVFGTIPGYLPQPSVTFTKTEVTT